MLKIENTEVLGWDAAIRGMRNPLNSWRRVTVSLFEILITDVLVCVRAQSSLIVIAAMSVLTTSNS